MSKRACHRRLVSLALRQAGHAPDTESLITMVSRSALDHAGVAPKDVDFVTVGVFNNGLTPQGFEGGLVSLGEPELRFTPAVHVENACATGSAALHTAMDFIESGRGRIALVIGAEKMTAIAVTAAAGILLSGCYRKEEAEPTGICRASSDKSPQSISSVTVTTAKSWR